MIGSPSQARNASCLVRPKAVLFDVHCTPLRLALNDQMRCEFLGAMSTPEPNGRAERRTNMFVIATASSASFSGQVRIRNMSSRGALIEGADLPQLGERVKIRRAELAASGLVVRIGDGHVGLQFERPIVVEDWLPGGRRTQAHVDREFSEISLGGAASVQSSAAGHLPSSPTSANELEAIADMLDALADSLSEDQAILATYLEKLQVLDIASQKLRQLAAR